MNANAMGPTVRSAVIALDNISKRFGSAHAVDGVSLALEEGEFFALLGPSGCGKTTLLRLIAGFETPDSGRVLLDGEDMTRRRPGRRPVNLMFQSYALFPHMSVEANVSYGLEMERIDRPSINKRVNEILEATELNELRKRRPDQLSGGQRQRVALARALVKRPRVLLLDEPLAALDRQLREQMQFELKRLQHELGITFIVVTHDQEEAMAMADRVALMRDGAVEQLGTPRELYDKPISRFVAQFIGASNLIDGRLINGSLQPDAPCSPDSEIQRLHVNNTHGLTEGSHACLVLRPENVRISIDPFDPDQNALAAHIIDCSYRGQDVLLRAALEHDASMLIARVPLDHPELARFDPGQAIHCGWRPERTRLLAT